MRIVQRQDAAVRQQTAQLDGPHGAPSRPVHIVLSKRGEQFRDTSKNGERLDSL